LDLLLCGLGLLAELVSDALEVFPKALDGVEPEDLDECFPLLGLRLVDEVCQRASAEQKRFAADRLKRGGIALVRERGLSAKRAAREHLDGGLAAVVATHVPDGVLAALVREELDLSGEIPLERIGD